MITSTTAITTIPVRILFAYLPELLAVFQSLNFYEKRENKILIKWYMENVCSSINVPRTTILAEFFYSSRVWYDCAHYSLLALFTPPATMLMT